MNWRRIYDWGRINMKTKVRIWESKDAMQVVLLKLSLYGLFVSFTNLIVFIFNKFILLAIINGLMSILFIMIIRSYSKYKQYIKEFKKE